MSNRENLKNFLTQNYLKGIPNVYKIKSPNGQHYVLVNKNTFARNVLGRNNINSLNRMISKNDVLRYIARRRANLRNIPIYHLVTGSQNFNNGVRKENYVFRAWNPPYGMTTVRGPFGPIKLTNVNHHTLSKNNLRNLRALRRQNTKNTANFKRKFNAQQAKRRAYLVRAKNINGQNENYWVNNNGQNIHVNPSNWVQTNNYNKELVNTMREHFNGGNVKVFKLKMKRR